MVNIPGTCMLGSSVIERYSGIGAPIYATIHTKLTSQGRYIFLLEFSDVGHHTLLKRGTIIKPTFPFAKYQDGESDIFRAVCGKVHIRPCLAI